LLPIPQVFFVDNDNMTPSPSWHDFNRVCSPI